MMWLAPLKAAVKPPVFLSYLLLRATAVTQPFSPSSAMCAIRAATAADVDAIQRCNVATLPENYSSQFYESHLKSWPALAFVAEAEVESHETSAAPADTKAGSSERTKSEVTNAHRKKEVVGYVLARMEQHPPRFPSDFRNTRFDPMHLVMILVCAR